MEFSARIAWLLSSIIFASTWVTSTAGQFGWSWKGGISIRGWSCMSDNKRTAVSVALTGTEDEMREVLRKWAKKKKDINKPEKNTGSDTGDTLLHYAAMSGNLPALDALLKAGANTEVVNDASDTPLHVACNAAWPHIANVLMQYCNPDAVRGNGETALHTAIRWERTEVAKSLIRRANLNAKTDYGKGDTPLHLLAASYPTDGIREILDIILTWFPKRNVLNKEGQTALHEAARFGNTVAMRRLIAYGFKHDIKNAQGNVPLQLAVAAADKEGIRLLLKHKADIQTYNSKKETLVHTCVINGKEKHLSVMEFLLDEGCEIDARDALDRTALQLSIRIPGREKFAYLLIAEGSSLETRDAMGNTALHDAALASDAITEALINAGASISATNVAGDTPVDVFFKNARSRPRMMSFLYALRKIPSHYASRALTLYEENAHLEPMRNILSRVPCQDVGVSFGFAFPKIDLSNVDATMDFENYVKFFFAHHRKNETFHTCMNEELYALYIILKASFVQRMADLELDDLRNEKSSEIATLRNEIISRHERKVELFDVKIRRDSLRYIRDMTMAEVWKGTPYVEEMLTDVIYDLFSNTKKNPVVVKIKRFAFIFALMKWASDYSVFKVDSVIDYERDIFMLTCAKSE